MAVRIGVRMSGARGKEGVAQSVREAPLVGVVRTASADEARRRARALVRSGVELVEITFSVPGATDVTRELVAELGSDGPPWVGMGTVTDARRAEEALAAGATFLVTPNTSPEVARVAVEAGVFLVLGALTATEIVTARNLGADLVKVYPLGPVGGVKYLETVRQPLSDIPMLAAGGYEVEEIPAYRNAGASAFGLGPPLFGEDEEDTGRRIERALELARGTTIR